MLRLLLIAAFFVFPLPQPITIHILVGRSINESQAEQLAALADDFHSNHLKIVFDLPESEKTLELSVTNPPQIVGPLGIGELHKSQWADLTPFIEKNGYSLARFYPASLLPLEVDHQQIGLPFGVYPSMLFYNAELFEEALIAPPPHEFGSPTWTFETLREMSLELTLDDNGYAASEPAFDPSITIQWGFDDSWASLREYVSLWGADARILDDPLTQQAIEWYDNGLHREHFIPDVNESESLYGTGISNPFESGQLAMFYSHSWFLFREAPYFEFAWDIAAIPTAPDGSVNPRIHVDAFAIPAAAAHQEEVWQVFSWLLAPEQQIKLCRIFGCIPADEALKESTAAAIHNSFPSIDTDVIFESIDYAAMMPNPESWLPNDAESLLNDFFYDLQNGSIDNLDAALADLQLRVKALDDD